MVRHSRGKGPVVSVGNGFSQMFSRRADKKPAVILIVRGSNIAENVKNARVEVAMEQERLIHLENIIAGKQRGFYELGKALNEIKQSRLYQLPLHDSFAAYVKARWDMGKSQAYRFIHAYQVINNLSPIGGKLPVNESQVRPLAGLNPIEQRAAWKRFLAKAPGY